MSEEQIKIERFNNTVEGLLLDDPDYTEDEKKSFLEIQSNSKIPLDQKYELILKILIKRLEKYDDSDFDIESVSFINCEAEKDTVLYNIKDILRKYKMGRRKKTNGDEITYDYNVGSSSCRYAIDRFEWLCGFYKIEELVQLDQLKDKDFHEFLSLQIKYGDYPCTQEFLEKIKEE